jgi:hypothetical protein
VAQPPPAVAHSGPGATYRLFPYAAIPDAGDVGLIPPDTDIGIPIIGPPGFGDELLEETIVEVHVVIPLCDPDGLPEPPPLDYRPALCPLRKPPDNDKYTWLLADGWCNLEDPPPSLRRIRGVDHPIKDPED